MGIIDALSTPEGLRAIGVAGLVLSSYAFAIGFGNKNLLLIIVSFLAFIVSLSAVFGWMEVG